MDAKETPVNLDAWHRAYLARDPKLSQEDARKLAEDPDENVIKALAKNPKTPPDVLEKLSDSPNFMVQRGVARNPSGSPSAYRQEHL